MEQIGQIKSSVEIRKMARQQLKGKWGLAILLILVGGVILALSAILLVLSYIGLIIDFVIVGVLALGLNSCFLKIARGEKIKIENIFSGFKNFRSAFLLQLLIIIFTLLWSFIAMIPFGVISLIVLGTHINEIPQGDGFYSIIYTVFIVFGSMASIVVEFYLILTSAIIALYRYSMSYYILSDCQSIGAYEAIKKSKKMMKGYKWKLFYLNLSFIGWIALSIITYGIGFLWIIPYIETAKANFYENLKSIQASKEALQ
ncbi:MULTISPECIES: DUF975 family protein [Clostridium]|uniref:DUF975 family protein n=1 Tax=Clostridium TaxID=1485 RepID=UPI000824C6C6|nr:MULTISPECIES: DUF975 family protein [Clostridium]PJI09469.1 DUF975 domain-containing protein [Clostridium sp. CT7]